MARLHEYQGKDLLRRHCVAVPAGLVVQTGGIEDETGGGLAPETELPVPAVVKAQAFTTSRYALGLIRFAQSPEEVRSSIAELGRRAIDGFPVTEVLVEERLHIEQEYFFSYFVDDDAGAARFIFSTVAGSGVEDALSADVSLVHQATVDTSSAVRVHRIREVLRSAGIHGRELLGLSDLVARAIRAAIASEARSLEINPIVRTNDGRFVAADCRVSIDDYAVFRHPELGIEIARDFAQPPSKLDRIAYEVERDDYRGTFYFVQLAAGFTPEERYVGFHGAGGGGSMMSMDALSRYGFKPANYCDTSGNPPASKVYRAARIIAAQPSIIGYFGSGSGVASQEQVHSARGLVKAFLEIGMDLPVVVRLGGNLEAEAIHLLERYTRMLPVTVRGFGKDTSVAECVAELDRLSATAPDAGAAAADERRRRTASPKRPIWLTVPETYRFASPTGTVHFHHPTCLTCVSKPCVSSCVPQILKLHEGVPVLAIGREEAARGGCIECLACDVECNEHGAGGGFVNLPIPGLDEGPDTGEASVSETAP